ncbi:MAG: Gfo/Idh/MocA family oxidoreductase, partial [Rhizobacter sp.]
DDGNLLLRFTNGARGVLIASQIEAGNENDIRLRVFGERGMLDWRQEDPNHLVHAPIDGPRMILTRNAPWLSDAAKRACRLPAGHPEAFIEAFANLYVGVAADIRSRLDQGQPASQEDADYPRIEAGARGVRFIEKTVESAASSQKWTSMR